MGVVPTETGVTTRDDGAVRVITLNRPEKLNAFSSGLYFATARALEETATDPGVAAVVLTGAGRAFSAGADLSEWDSGDTTDLSAGFDAMLQQLDELPQPLIAAVNGLAVGIGTTLLLHCDLVMADETARFRTPFVALGTVPEAGSSWLLPRAVGRQAGLWALLAGEWMDAPAALAAGLAWRVTPTGTVVEAATAVARQLAALPQAPLRATKRLVRDGLRAQIVEVLRREGEAGRDLRR